MPEENIKTDAQLTWPAPDEVIQPISSNEQEELWEEIEEDLDEETLNAEVRLVELPRNVREYLAAITTSYTLIKIGRNLLLKPEQIQKLAKIVKLYYVDEIRTPQELVAHMEVDLSIDEKRALSIYNDGDFKRILAPKTTPQERTVSLGSFGETGNVQEGLSIPVIQQKPEAGKPLILHEEKSLTEGTQKPPILKGFALPFGLFKSRIRKEEAEPVRARVEAPKEEKRIVHYSELRTPLAPLGSEEVINLETFASPTVAPPPAPAPQATVPEGNKPTIEGNIVDLRKQ